MNAGIILATTGTTAVSSEFPSVAPKWLASATDAKSVAQSPKLERVPDHHKIEKGDLENIFTDFISFLNPNNIKKYFFS